jgi:hypothetical protein
MRVPAIQYNPVFYQTVRNPPMVFTFIREPVAMLGEPIPIP